VQTPTSHSTASEREELKLIVEALARTPRLARLLQFLGDRYLEGRIDEITEYNIATEVFGRSRTSFDCATDSIARVEVHRLRKRLKEYYESEGKRHDLLITIPLRSYVPEFSRRPAVDPDAIDDLSSVASANSSSGDFSEEFASRVEEPAAIQGEHETRAAEAVPSELSSSPKRRLGYAVALAALAVLVVSAAGYFVQNRATTRTANSNLREASQSFTPANAAQVPLRLLCGYDGSPRIDSAGAYWQSDRYFSGGTPFARPQSPILRTSDPMLFEHWRTGEFTYDIPMPPGPYELHLFFVAMPPDDFKTQFFDVQANGHPLLSAFNISADALGTNVADEKVFKDIYPTKDGYLHLKFGTVRSTPYVNAIEILPGISHRQLPIRLVMQASAITDHNGDVWHPDNYFENGTLSDLPEQVSGTPDPELYSQERYGHFTYSIPVDPNSRYTVILHFAEHYWGVGNPGSGAGKRLFRVYSGGTMLLDNFDIYNEAGSLHAIKKTFYHLRPSPEGKINLTFEPIVNFATVSMIEVIDESS